MGHVISSEGVAIDDEKVEATLAWPRPKDIKELLGFLGLTGYYRCFVKGYAHVAQGLTKLLQKDVFSWYKEVKKSFVSLKLVMTQGPVLAMPNFQALFVVETDTSHHGLGAFLLQEKHPIAFFSKVLALRASGKSIYEKELMAIAFAVLK